jgi:hypothetical protein
MSIEIETSNESRSPPRDAEDGAANARRELDGISPLRGPKKYGEESGDLATEEIDDEKREWLFGAPGRRIAGAFVDGGARPSHCGKKKSWTCSTSVCGFLRPAGPPGGAWRCVNGTYYSKIAIF